MSHHTNKRLGTPAILAVLALVQLPAAQASVVERRDEIERSEKSLALVKALERTACDRAAAALSAFVGVPSASASELQALAVAASQTRETCTSAEAATKAATETASVAWDKLKKHLALASVMEAGTVNPLAKLIESAAGAQERVDKARSKYADPYGAGDIAASQLLSAKNLDAAELKQKQEQVVQVRASANTVRKALTDAQRAANSLVDTALQLKTCADPCTDVDVQQAAFVAQTQLNSALKRAKDTFDGGQKVALEVAVGVTYNDPTDRSNAIAFAHLLDTFPDARSALGEASAFGLSAIGTSKVASIKIGGARNLPYGFRQTSFTLSAPLDSSENKQLYTRGTGFNNAASLAASTYWLLGGSRDKLFAGKTYLTAAGVNASTGLGGKHSYLGDDLKERDAERLFREGSVGGYVSLFRQSRDALGEAVGNPTMHVISMDAQREMALGKKTTRCAAKPVAPSASLGCVTGYFTAPDFKYSRLFSYEYRLQDKNWAFAPKLQYEDVSHLTTLRAPVYLIRSGDPKADKAFNAGVELVWARGRDDAGKRVTDRTLGLFVGLPFTLGEVNRD